MYKIVPLFLLWINTLFSMESVPLKKRIKKVTWADQIEKVHAIPETLRTPEEEFQKVRGLAVGAKCGNKSDTKQLLLYCGCTTKERLSAFKISSSSVSFQIDFASADRAPLIKKFRRPLGDKKIENA